MTIVIVAAQTVITRRGHRSHGTASNFFVIGSARRAEQPRCQRVIVRNEGQAIEIRADSKSEWQRPVAADDIPPRRTGGMAFNEPGEEVLQQS